MLETAQTITAEKVLFDADAEQRYELSISDDDAQYDLTQVFKGLPDEPILEYDRLREVLLESDGKKNDVNTDSMQADEYLFRELCVDVLGFDGDKPEHWHDLIDYEEKKFGIGKLLGVKILSDETAKPKKLREWGAKTQSDAVEIKARFGDKILTTKAIFHSKTPADIAAYAVIKNRVSLVDNDLEDSAIKIPASMRRKAELFDRINPRVEGYAGRVPVHHKAAFITGFFEPKISSAGKK